MKIRQGIPKVDSLGLFSAAVRAGLYYFICMTSPYSCRQDAKQDLHNISFALLPRLDAVLMHLRDRLNLLSRKVVEGAYFI